jgi:hypothetical protein
MPERFAQLGDLTAGMDEAAGSLESLLDLSAEQAAQGLGDAPWPPHYKKGVGEPPRVQPSKRRKSKKSKKRVKMPLITIAKAAREDEALAGLERWKVRHPEAAAQLAEEDILVDAMRGRSTTWTRIRVNLRSVPVALRPPEEAPDPDYDPWKKI